MLAIFANGFKNPLGALVIGSIFGLPLACYLAASLPSHLALTAATWVLVLGRALGLYAEASVTWAYLSRVLGEDGSH